MSIEEQITQATPSEEQCKPATILFVNVEGIETRMIGRDAELKQLQETLDTVIKAERTHIIIIVGEAGIGKTRLVYEFENGLERLPEPVWIFKGRATQETGKLPYALIRDMFSFRFEILDSDPPEVARKKLEHGIVGFMGPDGVEKAHFIGHLIGFDFSESPYLRGILNDTQQIYQRAFHYVSQFFMMVTKKDLGVVYLEGLHWADNGSLSLIEHLGKECCQVPMLLIALARPQLFEQRSSWGQGQEHYTYLRLYPLSTQDSHRLVDEILQKVEKIPPGLCKLIVDRAAGNPFFMEELIKMLIEVGVIVKGGERWQVQMERLAKVHIPPTLTGVIQARLDGLPKKAREIMQRAAIVGRIFWESAVEYLSDKPQVSDNQNSHRNVRPILEMLQARELVFRRQTSTFEEDQEYIFKHALLHEVIYESMLKQRRREYHRQVARWLTERSGERVGEYAGIIGKHYEQAGNKALAAKWYGEAGKQAQDTYAIEVALDYYQKALALLANASEHLEPSEIWKRQVALYKGLSKMLLWQARYPEAIEACTAMHKAAKKIGDHVAQARAWLELAWVHDCRGDNRAMLESLERAEKIARATDAQVELAMALSGKGWAFYRLGNTEMALALGGEALALSLELDNQTEIAYNLIFFGTFHGRMLGNYEQSRYYMEKALELYRELGNRKAEGTTLMNMGDNALSCGDYDATVRLCQEALLIAREIGDRSGEIACLCNLGGAQVGLGEYTAAEVNLRQSLSMAEPINDSTLSETSCYLAEAFLGQGKLAEARAAARQALRFGQQAEQQNIIGMVWRVKGMVAAESTEPVTIGNISYDAAGCFTESLRIFKELGIDGERARTLRQWAQYELEKGEREQGRAMWQEARKIFERLGMKLEIERMTKVS